MSLLYWANTEFILFSGSRSLLLSPLLTKVMAFFLPHSQKKHTHIHTCAHTDTDTDTVKDKDTDRGSDTYLDRDKDRDRAFAEGFARPPQHSSSSPILGFATLSVVNPFVF